MRSNLSIRNRQRTRRVDTRFLARLTRTLLRDLLQIEAFDFSIYLVEAEEITRINEQFLRHQGWTDVITFDYNDPAQPDFVAGEIVVCVEAAVRQGRRFRVPWQCEMIRYMVHGVLHLRGYDDRTRRARRRMKREEARLVKELTERFQVGRLRSLR